MMSAPLRRDYKGIRRETRKERGKNTGKNARRSTAKTREIGVDTRKGGNTHKIEESVSKQRGRRTTKKGRCVDQKGFSREAYSLD